MLHSVYDQPDAASVNAHATGSGLRERQAPSPCTTRPPGRRPRSRPSLTGMDPDLSNDPNERLNREIRRRTDSGFPNCQFADPPGRSRPPNKTTNGAEGDATQPSTSHQITTTPQPTQQEEPSPKSQRITHPEGHKRLHHSLRLDLFTEAPHTRCYAGAIFSFMATPGSAPQRGGHPRNRAQPRTQLAAGTGGRWRVLGFQKSHAPD